MERAERWRRVSELLFKALDLPAGERTSFVAGVVREEPALRTDVLALWEELRHTSSFLEEPATEEVPPPRAGDAFGPYRVLRELGEGGMGLVLLAERDDGQFTRRVAIKRVAGAFPAADALRRFADERQILARLDHPNITRLLDSGVDAAGVPYLVMEHVEGVSLTAYGRQHALSVRDRLALFLKVCGAVQHAHRSLVIHRDIKPANILVTAAGEPKLLDFGIAKEFAGSMAAEMTLTTNRALTLDFASPEQVRGELVTTAGDVYSLGVLLYELLADRRPYDVGDRGLADAVRLVCEQVPPLPSRTAPPERRPELQGDLDSIVMKAIEKAPADRYASVAELGADVSAHLTHLPVKARQPSFRYVARKLVRRHRTAAAVAAAITVVILSSLSAVVWQARNAERQRARAEGRFQEVQQLAHYLIFDLHDGVMKLPASTELRRQMVERSLTYLDSLAREARGDTRLQLELANGYVRLGDVLGKHTIANLGDRPGGMASWNKARDLLQEVLREQPRHTAARQNLARLLIDMNNSRQLDHPSADDSDLRESVRLWEELLAEQPQDEQNLRGLASAHFAAYLQDMKSDGRLANAHLKLALELFERLLAARPDDLDRKRNVALCHKNLAARSQNDPEAFLQHAETAARYDRERLAAEPDNPQAKLDYSFDLSTLGTFHERRLDYATALRFFEEALVLRREMWKDDPADVFVRGRLAYVLVAAAQDQVLLDQSAAAAPRLREAIELVQGAREGQVEEARTLTMAYLLSGDIARSTGRDPCPSYRALSGVIGRVPEKQLPWNVVRFREMRDRALKGVHACP